jgi:hypothetical protein
VTLPTTVDAERAAAAFQDGVLTITLPKAEIATPKTIPVSGGSSGQESSASAGPTEVEITQPGGSHSGQSDSR